MITGAIFDLDGTLVDSNGYWDLAPEAYLRACGKEPEPGIGQKIFAMTVPDAADYLRREYGIDQSPAEIVQGINDTMKHFYLHDIPLKDGVREGIGKLAKRHIPMAVASVTDKALVTAVLERFGLLDLISAIVTTDDAGVGNQEPDVYYLAAKAIGRKPENTLVFEDALHALVTAKRGGFPTVGVYDDASAEKQEEIRKTSDFYIRTFWEIEAVI